MHEFKKGFTLIEMMIAVAIVGILAAIAVAQYQNLIVKSKEGTSLGNLGTLRSALSVYYGDLDGNYPTDTGNLDSLTTGGKYLAGIPFVVLPISLNSSGHPQSSAVTTTAIDDTGGFFYYNDRTRLEKWGTVVINCVHRDMRGSVWSVE